MGTYRPVLGEPGVWLLDVDLGGRIRRWATSPVTVTDAAGQAYEYEPGLSTFAGELEEATRTVSVDATPVPLGVAELASRGLVGGEARIRWWQSGVVLERAITLLRGIVTDVTYGADDEPMEITIERAPLSSSRPMPDPTQSVSDPETWPVTASYETPSQSAGAPYPLVIGYPGNVDGTAFPAYPVPLVEWDVSLTVSRWVVGADLLRCVEGGEVTLFGYGDDAAGALVTSATSGVPRVPEVDYDAVGRRVTVVIGDSDLYADSSDSPTPDWWAGHTADGGGVPDPWSDGTLRGAGSVLLYLLSRYTSIPIDAAMVATHRPWLDAVLIDCAIWEPVDCLTWIQVELLPLLGVRERWSADGVWWQPLQWAASPADRVLHLDADAQAVERVERVETARPTATRISLEYRYTRGVYAAISSIGPEYGRQVTISPGFSRSLVGWQHPGLPSGTDTRIYGSPVLATAEARYGASSEALSTGLLWDTASAGVVLERRALAVGWAWRRVTYSGGVELLRLDIGDIVTITDSQISLSEQVARVDRVVIDGAAVDVEVVILDAV